MGGGGSYISIKQMKLAVMTLCQDTEISKMQYILNNFQRSN